MPIPPYSSSSITLGRRLRSLWRKAVTGNEKKKIREYVIENVEEPKNIRFLDKCAFTTGVLNIMCCQYFLLIMPAHFGLWYSIVMSLLMIARIYHFRSLSFDYFLYDHCYFSILLTFVQMYVLPHSATLWKVCFLYANGPLPLAILVWGNSFVFHDFDKMSSVYIHLLPSCLTYSLRWYGTQKFNSLFSSLSNTHSSNSTCNLVINEELSSSQLNAYDYVFAGLVYVAWQLCYFLKTEVLDREKLDKRPDISTSLRWLSKDKKNFLGKVILNTCRRVGLLSKDEIFDSNSFKTKFIFMTTQFVYSMLSFLISSAVFYSQTLHVTHISIIFTISVYNGGSYYVEIFSTRYQQLLETKEKMRSMARTVAHSVAEVAILGDGKAVRSGKANEDQETSLVKPEKGEELGRQLSDLKEATDDLINDIFDEVGVE